MKFQVTMKDPDTLQDSIKAAVKAEVAVMGLPTDEAQVVIEFRYVKVADIAALWFEYGEYITVEIDTEAKTCLVVESGQ